MYEGFTYVGIKTVLLAATSIELLGEGKVVRGWPCWVSSP